MESSSICIETMSLLLCTLYAIKDTYVLTFITVASFCGECALSAWFLLLLIIIMTHESRFVYDDFFFFLVRKNDPTVMHIVSI